MAAGGVALDLNWTSSLLLMIGLWCLYLVKNTASRKQNDDVPLPRISEDPYLCAVCTSPSSKKCSTCKSVGFCSLTCQKRHWKSKSHWESQSRSVNLVSASRIRN